MKFFKIIIFSFLFLTSSFAGTDKGIFGFRFGYTMSFLVSKARIKAKVNRPYKPRESNNFQVLKDNSSNNARKSINFGISWLYPLKGFDFITGLDFYLTGDEARSEYEIEYSIGNSQEWWNYYKKFHFYNYSHIKYKISYIHIPVIFRLQFNPFIEVGSSIGYSLSSKLHYENLLNTNINEYEDITENKDIKLKNNFEISFVVGLGVKLSKMINFSTRIYLGKYGGIKYGESHLNNTLVTFNLNFNFIKSK